MAPYRCHSCGIRFYAGKSKSERGGRERSLAEYLGLRGREYRLRNWLISALTTLLLLTISIVLLLRIIG